MPNGLSALNKAMLKLLNSTNASTQFFDHEANFNGIWGGLFASTPLSLHPCLWHGSRERSDVSSQQQLLACSRKTYLHTWLLSSSWRSCANFFKAETFYGSGQVRAQNGEKRIGGNAILIAPEGATAFRSLISLNEGESWGSRSRAPDSITDPEVPGVHL